MTVRSIPLLVHDLAAENQVSIDPSTMENSTGRLLLQGNGNYVRIDAGVTLTQASITLGTNCSLVVGPDCCLAMIEIMGSRNGHISIGAGTQFTWSTRLYLHEPGCISIGKACLIASNTLLTVSDMHSVLDLESGQRINPAADVTLADKVWLAHETTVLKGSHIGSGCMIGYSSIVSGAIPANSVAGGSPARVIKSGITWDHGLLWPRITTDHPLGRHRLMASRARAHAVHGYDIKPFQTPYTHGKPSFLVNDLKGPSP